MPADQGPRDLIRGTMGAGMGLCLGLVLVPLIRGTLV
jgi:hypothetical protein